MEIKREEAIDVLKAYFPDYLKSQGYRINRGNASPCCSGGRYTKNSFHYNRKSNTVKCFACGFCGDIYDFVAMQYGLKTFNEAFQKTADLLGFTITGDKNKEESSKLRSLKPVKLPVLEEVKPEPEIDRSGYLNWAERNNDYIYLENRGISRAVQKRFKIGYDPNWRNPKTVARWQQEGKDLSKLPSSPRCIIPNGITGYFARDTRKGLVGYEQNFTKQAIGSRRPFNVKALKRPGIYFVVEGEIDALSVIEGGFEGIGLCGAANIRSLVDELKKAPKGIKIVVMLDPDKAGRLNGEKLCKELRTLRIPYVDASKYIDQKADPNAQLIEDREKFIQNLKGLAALLGKRKGKGVMVNSKISEKLIETVKKEWFAQGPDENGCYIVEIPADYRDTNEGLLPTAYKERQSADLKNMLIDSIYEAHSDYIYQCQADLLEKAGFEPFDIDYEEAEATMYELIYFEPDYEHFMKDDMNLNLLIGTQNEQNRDFTAINEYFHWGEEDAKINGLAWLIKQQGYTVDDLKKAMDGKETGSKFLNSVCDELANHTYSMGCLTILVKSNLEEYCDIFQRDEVTKKLITRDLVLPKDTMLGIFNPWNGSGSMLDIQLEKALVLPTELIWDCQIEGVKPGYTYSVDDVYGLIDSCWKESIEVRDRNLSKPLDMRIKDCASKIESEVALRTAIEHDEGLNK